MTLLMLIAGLALLVIGAEYLVRGAVSLATALGVSPLVIGLTLVGFGTSTPELMTSVQAALIGAPGVAVGNVVGSNICNVLLILGVAALIRPVTADPAAFRRDGPVLAAATAVGLGLLLWGELGRLAGGVLVALLAAYVVVTYRLERTTEGPAAAMRLAGLETPPVGVGRGLPVAAATAIGGLALVMLGAHWLVTAAVEMAQAWNVSDALIGLTVVAVGTSLPELVTSVTAALRGQSDIAFGNVVGSNIFNILGILGVTALVSPIAVPAEIMRVDGWVMAAAAAALIAASLTGWKVCRLEGGLMLGAYAGYLAWLTAAGA